jgi:peptidyl-tRNA hydrolase
MPKKMYILVRKDLSPSQRAVQACHAVAELLRHRLHDP